MVKHLASLAKALRGKLRSFRRPDRRYRKVRELDALLVPARERYIICRQVELLPKEQSANSRPGVGSEVHLAIGQAHVMRVAFVFSDGPTVEVEPSIKEE